MSKVLTSFLVGIGFDTKGLESGVNKVQGSMQGVKTGALGISAALVGAFGAATASVVTTANRVDQLALATQNLRTSQNYVYDYGNALKLLGGDANDALTTIQAMEEILNNAQLKGDIGPLAELPMAGVDIFGMDKAGSGEELLRMLSEQIPALNEGQRALVQESLGLSDAVMRSIAGGADELDRVMEKANSLTGNVEQLNENSRKLAENAAQFSLTVEGITNEMAEKFLPSLIGASGRINQFLQENREGISAGIDKLAENPEATAGLLGGAAAVTAGAGASKIGMKTIGGALKGAGQIGLVISAADLASGFVDPFFDMLLGIDRSESSEAGSGSIIRSQEDIDYLNRRDSLTSESSPRDTPTSGFTASDADTPTSGFTASDAVTPQMSSAVIEEERRANANALAGALSRQPVKVENTLNVQLDGQAIEAKIVDVTERMQYDTSEDLRSTTER